IKAVAETHKTCSFIRGIDVEDSCHDTWLLCDNAYGASIETGEADDNILCKIFLYLEKFTIVHNIVNSRFHVIGLGWIIRNDAIETTFDTSGSIRRYNAWWIIKVVWGKITHQLTNLADTILFAGTGEV